MSGQLRIDPVGTEVVTHPKGETSYTMWLAQAGSLEPYRFLTRSDCPPDRVEWLAEFGILAPPVHDDDR